MDGSVSTRKTLRIILEQAGCSVVGEGADGEQVIELYERVRPELVLIDVDLTTRDGRPAAAALLERHPEAIIVLCSAPASRDKIAVCQRAGVAHYLLKPFKADKLMTEMRYVHARIAARQAAARQRRFSLAA
jgi:two-component system chemotaxis response regulator CheY